MVYPQVSISLVRALIAARSSKLAIRWVARSSFLLRTAELVPAQSVTPTGHEQQPDGIGLSAEVLARNPVRRKASEPSAAPVRMSTA
jgi:hypothetical protein